MATVIVAFIAVVIICWQHDKIVRLREEKEAMRKGWHAASEEVFRILRKLREGGDAK